MVPEAGQTVSQSGTVKGAYRPYEKELEKAGRDPDSREGVSLLTMHASKGLEFDTVLYP